MVQVKSSPPRCLKNAASNLTSYGKCVLPAVPGVWPPVQDHPATSRNKSDHLPTGGILDPNGPAYSPKSASKSAAARDGDSASAGAEGHPEGIRRDEHEDVPVEADGGENVPQLEAEPE